MTIDEVWEYIRARKSDLNRAPDHRHERKIRLAELTAFEMHIMAAMEREKRED